MATIEDNYKMRTTLEMLSCNSNSKLHGKDWQWYSQQLINPSNFNRSQNSTESSSSTKGNFKTDSASN